MPPTLTTRFPDAGAARGTPPGLPRQTALQEILHEPHAELRNRLLEIHIASPLEHDHRIALRMATCADSVFLYPDPIRQEIRPSLHRCMNPLCPLCAKTKSGQVAAKLDLVIENYVHPRHLVLTIRSSPTPLKDQLRDLVKWFAKLRRLPWWKKHVTAGVYVKEVTVNKRTSLFHPHFHCLFDGDYIAQKQIRYAWHKITGGAEIVWIEDVYSRHSAVAELTKYLGKPTDCDRWSDAQLLEYSHATQGMRMIQTFGQQPPHDALDAEELPIHTRTDWHVSLSKLLYLTDHGDGTAAKLLILIAEAWPYLGRVVYHHCPQLEPDVSRIRRRLAAADLIERGPRQSKPRPPPHRPMIEVQAEIWPLVEQLRIDDEALPAFDTSAGDAYRRVLDQERMEASL